MKKLRPQISTGMVKISWISANIQHHRAADQRNDQPLFADGVGDGDADVVHIGQCSLKTGFVDDVYQRLLGDRRVTQNGGAVGGKVDVDLNNAVGTAQCALHRSGTGGAGHALNINFDMFCFGQENSSFPVGDGL